MYFVAHLQYVEEVYYLQHNNPYYNTYNPWCKNHQNFSWKDQQGIDQNQGSVQYQNQQQSKISFHNNINDKLPKRQIGK